MADVVSSSPPMLLPLPQGSSPSPLSPLFCSQWPYLILPMYPWPLECGLSQWGLLTPVLPHPGLDLGQELTGEGRMVGETLLGGWGGVGQGGACPVGPK